MSAEEEYLDNLLRAAMGIAAKKEITRSCIGRSAG